MTCDLSRFVMYRSDLHSYPSPSVQSYFTSCTNWRPRVCCTPSPVHGTSAIPSNFFYPLPPFIPTLPPATISPSDYCQISEHLLTSLLTQPFSDTMTRTTSQAPETNNRSPQNRCQRCSRKFRTSKDLALHILSKHGHVYIPQPEDTRSVTLSSPLIASNDTAELDQLLQVVEQKRARPLKRKRHPLSKQRVTPGVAKRVWTYTSSNSTDSSSSNASSSASNAPLHLLAFDGKRAMWGNQEDVSPGEGESTGPRAKDVFVARCRAGRIPLVPIQAPSPATLNFANGLF